MLLGLWLEVVRSNRLTVILYTAHGLSRIFFGDRAEHQTLVWPPNPAHTPCKIQLMIQIHACC